MAQVNINIRIDENLKRGFEALCAEMGLTMTAAFTVFAKAVMRKRAIPFDISAENESTLTRKATTADEVGKMTGILHKYANPALVPPEGEAWGKAVKEKHAAG